MNGHAFALALAAVFALVPPGSTETTSTETAPQTATVESWYQPNPSCATPVGCLAPVELPPLNPYPAGTLHVAVSGGAETARSYLGFELANGDKITAAVLTVPLSINPADGGANSATADVQVCLAFGAIVKVEGSFAQPPSVDCLTSATATYVAAPQPHLEADLAPLLDNLASATGLALLPDATKATQSDSWRVVFSAHDRAGSPTPPASLALKFAEPEVGTPDPGVFGDGFGPAPRFVGDILAAVDPPIGTGFAAPASPALPVNSTAPPEVGSRQASAAGEYPYKAAWLMPLLLLGLFPAVLGAMRQDLTPTTSRLRNRPE